MKSFHSSVKCFHEAQKKTNSTEQNDWKTQKKNLRTCMAHGNAVMKTCTKKNGESDCPKTVEDRLSAYPGPPGGQPMGPGAGGAPGAPGQGQPQLSPECKAALKKILGKLGELKKVCLHNIKKNIKECVKHWEPVAKACKPPAQGPGGPQGPGAPGVPSW